MEIMEFDKKIKANKLKKQKMEDKILRKRQKEKEKQKQKKSKSYKNLIETKQKQYNALKNILEHLDNLTNEISLNDSQIKELKQEQTKILNKMNYTQEYL